MSGHLSGGVSAAEQMFDELAQGGTNVTPQEQSSGKLAAAVCL
jgi:hypothetical protein